MNQLFDRRHPKTPMDKTVQISQQLEGQPLTIGPGFSALTFREKRFDGMMDPLVMVDHYNMTMPTFGAHPHAGLSAVSVLFEDSKGALHNRDSLGNDVDLMPGDLYWLKAGAGVIHDESPRPGAHTHGLQIFVNLPSAIRTSAPAALHVKSANIPCYQNKGARIRVVLGNTNGVFGHHSPALPMTILDGQLESDSAFTHELLEGENAWLYVVSGELEMHIQGTNIDLAEGQSIALSCVGAETNQVLTLSNTSTQWVHFALFVAEPIREAFVQQGPFVMGSLAEIQQVNADYAAGKFGNLT